MLVHAEEKLYICETCGKVLNFSCTSTKTTVCSNVEDLTTETYF